MIDNMFAAGDLLEDKVTGITGIVMVIAKYSTGCIHYGIQPRNVKEDGSIPNWVWLDEHRYRLVKKQAVCFDTVVEKKDKTTSSLVPPGGDFPSGPQL